MVRTRAQRVANDEAGVEQSPQQVLTTPKRKTQKRTAKKFSNATIRDETRDSSPPAKSKAKAKAKKPSQSKTKEPSRIAVKKTRLRNVASKVKSQTENTISLPQDMSDTENHESEETSKSERTALETRKGRSKALPTQNGKSTKAATTNGDNTANGQITPVTPAIRPNNGLSDVFSRLSPHQPSSSPQSARKEESVSVTNDKEVIPPSDQVKAAKSSKAKSKEQRALQEQGSNKQKATAERSTLAERANALKRKRLEERYRSESDEDEDDLDLHQSPTAKYSFRADPDGHLGLVSRNQLEPEDGSIVYVEAKQAAKLISQEFERKKQVRFADRIAEQHPEFSPEEKAAQQAALASQHVKVNTDGFFGKDLARNGSVRALARKLDVGIKTMLEKVDSLTTSDDKELCEILARDLMELAFAIKAAGPQAKEATPTKQSSLSTWTNSQSDKENKSATTSPEVETLSPVKSLTAKAAQSVGPITTPGRLFASIRKLRSFLPFGGSSSQPEQSSNNSSENVPTSPASPTPNARNEAKINHSKDSAKQDKQQHSTLAQDDTPKYRPLFEGARPQREVRGLTPKRTSPSSTLFNQPMTPKTPVVIEAEMTEAEKEKKKQEDEERSRIWEESNKRKIGSAMYPLTADGKIPRPAPRAWGMNDAYFYEAEDSDDSDYENKEEPLPKRRRLSKTPTGPASKRWADIDTTTQPSTRFTYSQTNKSRSRLTTPAPRVFTLPEYSSSSDEEATPPMPSAERREIERQKMRRERLEHAVNIHRPKTPSRLREMARASKSPKSKSAQRKSAGVSSPIDSKYRFRKCFKLAGSKDVLTAFIYV